MISPTRAINSLTAAVGLSSAFASTFKLSCLRTYSTLMNFSRTQFSAWQKSTNRARLLAASYARSRFCLITSSSLVWHSSLILWFSSRIPLRWLSCSLIELLNPPKSLTISSFSSFVSHNSCFILSSYSLISLNRAKPCLLPSFKLPLNFSIKSSYFANFCFGAYLVVRGCSPSLCSSKW